jgi:hypothetical protein
MPLCVWHPQPRDGRLRWVCAHSRRGVVTHSLRRRLSYGAKPLKKAAGAAGATHRTHAKAAKSAPRGFTQSAHVLPVVTRTKPVAKPARPRSRSRSPK